MTRKTGTLPLLQPKPQEMQHTRRQTAFSAQTRSIHSSQQLSTPAYSDPNKQTRGHTPAGCLSLVLLLPLWCLWLCCCKHYVHSAAGPPVVSEPNCVDQVNKLRLLPIAKGRVVGTKRVQCLQAQQQQQQAVNKLAAKRRVRQTAAATRGRQHSR